MSSDRVAAGLAMTRGRETGGILRRVRPLLGSLLALLVAAGLMSLTASAQEGDLTVNLVELSSDDPASADATVTVLDAGGRPVADLSAADFMVRIDGGAAPAAGLERGIDRALPISVLLALDVSGSMEGGALEEAKAAAIRFLDGLEPQDNVAILTFADGVDLVLDFTQDRGAALVAIDGLTAAGATALYQATDESLRLVADEANGYRAVVLLSDGLDNGSAVARDAALAAAGTQGVPVFAIGLGQDIDRAYLQELADGSGGRFTETPSPSGLAALYDEAAAMLRGQYILTLDTSALSFSPSEPATLRVDVAAAGRVGTATRVFCPQRLCVALAQIEPDERVDAARTVTAEVISSDSIESVTFLVDGEAVAEVAEPPYEFVLDPASFAGGDHALSVTAATVGGDAESAQLTLTIAGAGGGSSSMLLVGAVAVATLAGAAALFLFFRGRRRPGPKGKLRKLDPTNLRPPSKGGALLDDDANRGLRPDDPMGAPDAPVEAMGRLYVSGGNLAGQSYPVGSSPLSVGSGLECAIKLSAEEAGEERIPPEYVRVWVRDDELMIHEIRHITVMGPEGGRWAKLEPGDSFSVGPYMLRFELDDAEAAAPADAASPRDVPDVLRDRSSVCEERTQAGEADESSDAIAKEAGEARPRAEPGSGGPFESTVASDEIPNVLRDKTDANGLGDGPASRPGEATAGDPDEAAPVDAPYRSLNE